MGASIVAGIPRANNGPHSDSTLTIAEVAAVHEFGAPSVRIPERSFIRAGVRENLPELRRLQADLIKKVVQKRIGVSTAMNRMGQAMADKIREKLEKGPFTPLAPSTVRGKGHAQPLIGDTHELVDAIGFEVRK